MAASAVPATLPHAAVPLVPGAAEVFAHAASMLPPDLSYCLDEEVLAGALGGDERAFVDLFMPDAVRWFDAIADEGGAFVGRVRERYLAWRGEADPVDAMAVDWAGLGGLRWLLDEAAGEVVHAMGEAGREPTPEDVAALLPRLPGAVRVEALAAAIAARCADDAGRWGAEGFMAARDRASVLYERRREALGLRDAAIRERVGARRGGECASPPRAAAARETEEHTSELQSQTLI